MASETSDQQTAAAAEVTARRPQAPQLHTASEPGSPAYKLQQVTVLCPETKLPLPTSLYLSAAAFSTSIFTNVRVQCPHCDAEHRWSSADAFLTEFEGNVPPPGNSARFASSARAKKPPAVREVEAPAEPAHT